MYKNHKPELNLCKGAHRHVSSSYDIHSSYLESHWE